jgi:hypothetical protein
VADSVDHLYFVGDLPTLFSKGVDPGAVLEGNPRQYGGWGPIGVGRLEQHQDSIFLGIRSGHKSDLLTAWYSKMSQKFHNKVANETLFFTFET